MTGKDFIFYRDVPESCGWHETLAALNALQMQAGGAGDAQTQKQGKVMLDSYGRVRRSGESAGSAAAATGGKAGHGRAANTNDPANVTLRSLQDDDGADRIRALAGRLVAFATEFSLYGNVWQQWITYILIMHENPFTLACERRSVSATSTLVKLASRDLNMMYEIFNLDFRTAVGRPEAEILAAFTDYRIPYAQETENASGRQIRRLTGRLASSRDPEGFRQTITRYYAEYGAGIYGLYKAFRVDALQARTASQLRRTYMYDGDIACRALEGIQPGMTGSGSGLVPVAGSSDIKFDDLIGYEEQKKTLKDNTEAFLRGGHANNVLLYGDSGTGKSTSIHALMHDYYERGLRLVEIGKRERHLLPQVLAEVKKRNYRFIIFLDDLSFEENESDYKELKAMLEGALEARDDRVLIYATSNRRHLIRETWNDRTDMEHDGDIHRSDTMEEKLSLAARFGVAIYYPKPDYRGYINIVRTLAERRGVTMSDEELEDEARKWELRHGGTSGRAASQLITWLKGASDN